MNNLTVPLSFFNPRKNSEDHMHFQLGRAIKYFQSSPDRLYMLTYITYCMLKSGVTGMVNTVHTVSIITSFIKSFMYNASFCV